MIFFGKKREKWNERTMENESLPLFGSPSSPNDLSLHMLSHYQDGGSSRCWRRRKTPGVFRTWRRKTPGVFRTWSFSSPPASSRSEIVDAGSQFTITQMVAEGKRLQGEAFCARTHPGQEAAISQASDDITQKVPRKADDGWIEVVSTATGAGTIGMLVEATPTDDPRRACGQGLRVDFDSSDSDEDIGDEESCVCAGDCVRACACVPVCGVCGVRVCVVKSWRPGLRFM